MAPAEVMARGGMLVGCCGMKWRRIQFSPWKRGNADSACSWGPRGKGVGVASVESGSCAFRGGTEEWCIEDRKV